MESNDADGQKKRQRKRERESERQIERLGAPVALVISNSHIAGTDAFVSPLLSDQDKFIQIVFQQNILDLLEWIYFDARCIYIYIFAEYNWALKNRRLKQNVSVHKKKDASPSTQSTSSAKHIYTIQRHRYHSHLHHCEESVTPGFGASH